ncbi:MAG: CHASE3 domain-containing protein [Bacteroidota bacterium]|nr:CHASE3 domain-containing protein [Bacteroidota bacterium]
MENTILKRIFLVFGVGFIIFIILIFMYKASFQKLNENTRLLIHNLEVLDITEQVLGLIKDMEAGTRGYALTGEDKFLIPHKTAKERLPIKFVELKTLLAENPRQSHNLDTIQNLMIRKIQNQDFIIHLKRSNNLNFGYKSILNESSLLLDSIQVIAAKMKMEEERLRIYRSFEGSDSIMDTKILSTIFSITAVVIMLLSLLYILMEIRSKRKVKDLLDAVLQASQSAILSFSAVRQPDGRINDFICIQFNRIGATIASKPETGMIGRTMSDMFPESLESGLLDEYIKVAAEGKVYRTERFYPDEHKGKWFRIVSVKLEDGITVTYDDISKEKEYEVALQKFIAELKRSNSELEQFAFVASHDLQEPLRKIQAFGDRLKVKAGHLLTDETKIYMEKMLSASTRMSGLISDLLNFSRLVRAKDEFVPTDMNKVFQDVMSDLELKISKKLAKVTFDNIPQIEAVPSQMYQLIFNLMGNAIKFIKPDVPPIISVKSEIFTVKGGVTPSRHNQRLRITFEDNGIGFDPMYVDRIFVIFQRLHGKHAYEGTGIGLAICKRIVNNHDGIITASGVPGEGATFTVELPLYQNA